MWSRWLQDLVNITTLIELGTFMFGAYQFWANRRERQQADVANEVRARIDSNYQAWQVINSAQGKGGSGGRIDALADLLRNGVSLAGIKLDDAWLERVALPNANLSKSSMQRATLSRANLAGANLEHADLRGADLTDIIGWRELKSISRASVEGVRGAPAGFVAFASEQGAVDSETAAAPADELDSFSRTFRAV